MRFYFFHLLCECVNMFFLAYYWLLLHNCLMVKLFHATPHGWLAFFGIYATLPCLRMDYVIHKYTHNADIGKYRDYITESALTVANFVCILIRIFMTTLCEMTKLFRVVSSYVVKTLVHNAKMLEKMKMFWFQIFYKLCKFQDFRKNVGQFVKIVWKCQ